MQNAGPAPAPLSQMGPGGPPDGIGPGGPGMPPGFFPVSLDQMVIYNHNNGSILQWDNLFVCPWDFGLAEILEMDKKHKMCNLPICSES